MWSPGRKDLLQSWGSLPYLRLSSSVFTRCSCSSTNFAASKFPRFKWHLLGYIPSDDCCYLQERSSCCPHKVALSALFKSLNDIFDPTRSYARRLSVQSCQTPGIVVQHGRSRQNPYRKSNSVATHTNLCRPGLLTTEIAAHLHQFCEFEARRMLLCVHSQVVAFMGNTGPYTALRLENSAFSLLDVEIRGKIVLSFLHCRT